MGIYKIFEIYLNFSCNQKCIHCFNAEDFRASYKDMSFSKVSSAMFKMSKEGYKSLSLLGGEPTVYPFILKVVRLGKKLGYKRIMTFSNGLRYADPAFIDEMKRAGLTDTCLSVHGHNASLHESVTTVPGSFDKILAAM